MMSNVFSRYNETAPTGPAAQRKGAGNWSQRL